MTQNELSIIERMKKELEQKCRSTLYLGFEVDTKTFRRLLYLAKHSKTKRKRRKNIVRLWNEYNYLVPQTVEVVVFDVPGAPVVSLTERARESVPKEIGRRIETIVND